MTFTAFHFHAKKSTTAVAAAVRGYTLHPKPLRLHRFVQPLLCKVSAAVKPTVGLHAPQDLMVTILQGKNCHSSNDDTDTSSDVLSCIAVSEQCLSLYIYIYVYNVVCFWKKTPKTLVSLHKTRHTAKRIVCHFFLK